MDHAQGSASLGGRAVQQPEQAPATRHLSRMLVEGLAIRRLLAERPLLIPLPAPRQGESSDSCLLHDSVKQARCAVSHTGGKRAPAHCVLGGASTCCMSPKSTGTSQSLVLISYSQFLGFWPAWASILAWSGVPVLWLFPDWLIFVLCVWAYSHMWAISLWNPLVDRHVGLLAYA